MSLGYDPVLLEDVPIDDWIQESPDNIVVVLPSKRTLLLKKSYFLVPKISDIYVECHIEGEALMLQKTNQSKLYRNIGYYSGRYAMIDDKQWIRSLKKNKNKYELEQDTSTPNVHYINQETLLLTQIGLYKSKGENKVNKTRQFKRNIPVKDDVYFNELVSNALYQYSSIWYKPINGYLRLGDAYWESNDFKVRLPPMGTSKHEVIQSVKRKIQKIDQCFMELAPRNESDTRIFYRGMRQVYPNMTDEGDDVIVRNFLSVSDSFQQAVKFIHREKRCCIYKLVVDKGIPYINMITNTKYVQEKETLLPRNLVMTLTGYETIRTTTNKTITVRIVKVSKMRPGQFKQNTGCSPYPRMTIKAVDSIKSTKQTVSKKKTKKKETVPVLKQVPVNVEANLQVATPVKLPKKPRCPNGSRRNKQTGLCMDKQGNVVVETNVPPKVQPLVKPKKKRCPKGTRRNKQTGNCEPKN